MTLHEFLGVKERVVRLESEMARMRIEAWGFKEELSKFHLEFAIFKNVAIQWFDNLSHRMESLKQEQALTHAHLLRLEERMGNAESALALQQSTLIRIEEKLDRLGKAS